MKRNPNYFKEGRAHFDESRVHHARPTPPRVRTRSMNGDVDFIDNVDAEDR
jgi:peptide/nickel transport system substrate-binding protein